jgi:hypothetical protein
MQTFEIKNLTDQTHKIVLSIYFHTQDNKDLKRKTEIRIYHYDIVYISKC